MTNTTHLSFDEAIEHGIFRPEELIKYPEFEAMEEFLQFQFILKGLKNRQRHLRYQWAMLNNQLDFSQKPALHEAQRKIEKAISDLNKEEEDLYVRYAGK